MDILTGYRAAEINTLCSMVLCGKPSAMIPIQERYLEDAIKAINKFGLLKTTVKPLSGQWSELWIYKHAHMIDIIKSLPEKPKTIYDHWVLGKAFGYSDEAIADFLLRTRP